MGHDGDNIKPGRLHLLVKPGDCLHIGDAKVHVVYVRGRIKLSIEAPIDTYIELTRSFERSADAKFPRPD
jgi:hypothetical protein